MPGAEGRFTLTPSEAHRLADLLLDALVTGGFKQPDSARVAKNRWN
jgi:hypothetical protein